MPSYPVDAMFYFELETDDGVSLIGEGSIEGTLNYDNGSWYDPPWEDVDADLKTCSIEYVWTDEEENQVEGEMSGREAYDMLEAYGWDVNQIDHDQWTEIEPDYEEDYDYE